MVLVLKSFDTTAIQGMTQQTLIALTTTIESREWMRRKRSNGVPAEHPRASTTDDVECFFCTLRDTIGNHFTCKSVMTEWKKVCMEYSKRIKISHFTIILQHTIDFMKERGRPLINMKSLSRIHDNSDCVPLNSQVCLLQVQQQ